MRIGAQQRLRNETRIRAAMHRLLRGEIPAGGKCDISTLAQQSAVDRTAFYAEGGGQPDDVGVRGRDQVGGRRGARRRHPGPDGRRTPAWSMSA